MAQYFFDIIADGKLVPDEEGMILPDFDAARREASCSLAQLARAECHTEDLPKLTISVRTSEGPVFEAALQRDLGTTHWRRAA